MADSSSSLPPLCEKISYKNYFLRVVDLTILGFLFSLLLYRILLMNQNNSVWVVAFLCESFFSFIWLLITSIKWSPASYKSYPERLDERVHDLPSVDMFVTTADPVREPPILVANTLLSLLAVNYPANKLACYVSDDGCSPLTYFSLKEASKFAKIWVPFCKKYNIKVRAPFRYFLNPPAATESSEFSKDWEITKREYEKLSRRVEDATGDSHWLDAEDDFEDFSNTKPNDHSTIVKVVWENKGGVGVENEVPHFVYISREKRPNYLHHYKAGAMNFLVRVSGLMTNAPYMLNVDCDMYANEADVVRQAMCIFLQKSMNSNHCAFVQFPQEFYDSNADELTVLQSYLGRGIAGIQGPTYAGSGCFHTRRVMYGLSIDDLEDDGSLSSLATRKYLAEENLAREFGNSNEMVTSVVEALQRKPNPQNTLANSLEAAQEVGHCHFEYQTSWGKTIGWLYESTAEDANTSIGIHSRGWTSSYISPKPPAFLGAMPPGGPEAMLQLTKERTCAGLSLKSQELTALFLAVRLYCSFVMEFDIHTLLDSATLVTTLFVIYMIRFKLKASYMDDKDNFAIYYVVIPCVVLSVLIHPSTHHHIINKISWAFCVYLEAVSVLPQLRVMQNTKIVEPFTAHYVFALGIARFLSCAHWVLQVLDTRGRLLTALGYGFWPIMVLLSEIVQTFILADFCYYYVKSLMGGQLVLRLPSGVV